MYVYIRKLNRLNFRIFDGQNETNQVFKIDLINPVDSDWAKMKNHEFNYQATCARARVWLRSHLDACRIMIDCSRVCMIVHRLTDLKDCRAAGYQHIYELEEWVALYLLIFGSVPYDVVQHLAWSWHEGHKRSTRVWSSAYRVACKRSVDILQHPVHSTYVFAGASPARTRKVCVHTFM